MTRFVRLHDALASRMPIPGLVTPCPSIRDAPLHYNRGYEHVLTITKDSESLEQETLSHKQPLFVIDGALIAPWQRQCGLREKNAVCHKLS